MSVQKINLEPLDIERQNIMHDDFEELGIDVMSETFLNATPEELANRMIQIQKENKEAKAKAREETKAKAAIEKRGSLLNEAEGYTQYSKLMRDYPHFDDAISGNHWTNNLVRIMHQISYRRSIDTIANQQNPILDINELSYIEIAKSHLCIATFDHISSQMSDYMVSNPLFNINDSIANAKSVSYNSQQTHGLDENAESSAKPEWGAW